MLKMLKLFECASLLAFVAAMSSQASAQDASDKSYASDYADKKASVNLLEGGNLVGVTLDHAEDKDLIFNYDRGGQFTAPKNGDVFKFKFKADESYNRAKAAYNKGDWNEVVVNLRSVAYPILPLAVLPETATDIQPVVAMFLDSLLRSEKINEAFEVAKLTPMDSLSDALFNGILDVADALARAGRTADGFTVINGITVDAANYDRISRFLDTLAVLRKRGGEKDALQWYTKLNNAEGNVKKKLCTLWMIYCDLSQGNKMSADIYLSQLEGTKTAEEEFSLLKLVQGTARWGESLELFPKIAEAGTDEKLKKEATSAYSIKLSNALDNFAEGIVFGRLNSEWMPELLFKAGEAYKKQGNLVASNEIFTQIMTLYPDDFFSTRAKSQIVKIEKKAEKKAE